MAIPEDKKMELTRKLRIKKSRSLSVRGHGSWIGVEMEAEFLPADQDQITDLLVEQVDVLLEQEERRERDILEDRAFGGY